MFIKTLSISGPSCLFCFCFFKARQFLSISGKTKRAHSRKLYLPSHTFITVTFIFPTFIPSIIPTIIPFELQELFFRLKRLQPFLWKFHCVRNTLGDLTSCFCRRHGFLESSRGKSHVQLIAALVSTAFHSHRFRGWFRFLPLRCKQMTRFP